jgi:hypothetical protein
MRGRSDIAGDQYRLSARPFHKAPRLFRVVMFIEISDQDICTLASVRDRNRPPEVRALCPLKHLQAGSSRPPVPIESKVGL